MAEARVSQAGAAVELEQQTPGIEVFQAGFLAEVGFEGLGVTKLGVLVEIGNDELHVTKVGVLVEIDPKELPVATHFERFNPGPTPHLILPEPIIGYQLDENGSFWTIVTPQESTNLAQNGSFEEDLISGVQIAGGTWATNQIDDTLASRGFHSRRFATAGDTASIRQNYDIPGPTYVTWSFDLYMRNDHVFNLDIRIGSFTTLGVASGTLTAPRGGWRRYSFTYYDNDTGLDRTRTARLQTDGVNAVDFNTDGWQVEFHQYPTTYFDGDNQEFAYDADPYAYSWKSVRYFSPSLRSARTFNGGKEVSLEDYGFRTTSIVGLGMGDVTLDTAILASGEEILKEAFISGKEFSIIGKIFGNDAREVQYNRQGLINLLNILNSRSGAVMLGYQPVDRRGRPYGKKLWIYATFISGMGMNYISHYQENLELRFRVFSARVFDEFGKVQELSIGGEPAFDTTIYARNPNTGYIDPYLVGSNATLGGSVKCAVMMDDGSLLVGGSFTSIGGVSAKRCARWDPAVQTWAEFGAGFNDGEVNGLAIGRGFLDGIPIAVGSFTDRGDGLLAINRAALYNAGGGVWEQFDDGFDDTVLDIDVAPSGEVLVGGEFRQNAAAIENRYALAWANATLATGSTEWQAITTGSVGDVFCVKIAPDKTFYFGGDFTSLGGNGNCNRVASWTINAGAISALVQGLDNTVWDIEFGPDGYMYLVGLFNDDFQEERLLRRFARWTGREFEEVGRGEILQNFYHLAWDRRGYAYLAGAQGVDGDYETTGTVGFTSLYQWTGSTWVSADIRLTKLTAPSTGRLVVTQDGTLIVPTFAASNLRIAGHTEIDYQGTADAPVKFKIVGPCVLHKISNWTINKHVYFKSFNLVEGEILYLDFTGLFPIAYTNHRADVLNDILVSVSDVDSMKLVPGINNITIVLSGTFEAETAASIQWNDHFWSIDNASQ